MAFSGAHVHIASGSEATNDKLLSFADASHPKKIRIGKCHMKILFVGRGKDTPTYDHQMIHSYIPLLFLK